MSIKKILLAAAFGAVMSAPAFAADDLLPPPTGDDAKNSAFSLTGSFDVTSEYIFRGISQTDDGPAVQGGLNANYLFGDSGFLGPITGTLGFWGSNVELATANTGTDVGNLETDWIASLAGEVKDIATWSVGNTYYYYPSSGSPGAKLNYDEIWGTLGHDFGVAAVTGAVNWSPNFGLDSGRATYVNGKVVVPLKYVDAIGAVGHQWIQYNTKAGLPDYTDYKLGLGAMVYGVNLEADAITTSIQRSNSGIATGDACTTAVCDWTFIVTATKNF